MDINAKIILHSEHKHTGDELITYELEFPRYILAEVNTHREFTKNSASSRAIPFRKMVRSIVDGSFIPLAFQKNHSGMQGSKYFGFDELFDIKEEVLIPNEEQVLYKRVYDGLIGKSLTIHQWWEEIRDVFVIHAIAFHELTDENITKQLCNRLLEPFLAHKIVMTTSISGLMNFFELRCPNYIISEEHATSKSMKRTIEQLLMSDDKSDVALANALDSMNYLELQSMNTGQADIHIMELAEKMYFEYMKSVPTKLEVGQWHIPYGDMMPDYKMTDLALIQSVKNDYEPRRIFIVRDNEIIFSAHPTVKSHAEYFSKHLGFSVKGLVHGYEIGNNVYTYIDDFTPYQSSVVEEHYDTHRGVTLYAGDVDFFNFVYGDNWRIKISSVRCARLSYQTLGDNPEIDYVKDMILYETLSKSGHWSPFEHIGRAMDGLEYARHIRGIIIYKGDLEYPRSLEQAKNEFYALNEFGQIKIDEARLSTKPALVRKEHMGWSRNLKGFVQYRSLLDSL